MSNFVVKSSEEKHYRTWDSPNGTLYYFKVELDSGQAAEAGKKSPGTPPRNGDRYEVLKQPSESAPLHALPTLMRPVSDRSGSGEKEFKADPAKLRSENARSALHCAKDLVIAEVIALEKLGEYTGLFYSFIMKHAEEEAPK